MALAALLAIFETRRRGRRPKWRAGKGAPSFLAVGSDRSRSSVTELKRIPIILKHSLHA